MHPLIYCEIYLSLVDDLGFQQNLLTQISSAQDYYVQFTALANRVQGITQEVLLDCFVGGLEPNIGGMFLSKHQLAKLYKEKYAPKHRPLSLGFFPKAQANPPSMLIGEGI